MAAVKKDCAAPKTAPEGDLTTNHSPADESPFRAVSHEPILQREAPGAFGYSDKEAAAHLRRSREAGCHCRTHLWQWVQLAFLILGIALSFTSVHHNIPMIILMSTIALSWVVNWYSDYSKGMKHLVRDKTAEQLVQRFRTSKPAIVLYGKAWHTTRNSKSTETVFTWHEAQLLNTTSVEDRTADLPARNSSIVRLKFIPMLSLADDYTKEVYNAQVKAMRKRAAAKDKKSEVRAYVVMPGLHEFVIAPRDTAGINRFFFRRAWYLVSVFLVLSVFYRMYMQSVSCEEHVVLHKVLSLKPPEPAAVDGDEEESKEAEEDTPVPEEEVVADKDHVAVEVAAEAAAAEAMGEQEDKPLL